MVYVTRIGKRNVNSVVIQNTNVVEGCDFFFLVVVEGCNLIVTVVVGVYDIIVIDVVFVSNIFTVFYNVFTIGDVVIEIAVVVFIVVCDVVAFIVVAHFVAIYVINTRYLLLLYVADLQSLPCSCTIYSTPIASTAF